MCCFPCWGVKDIVVEEDPVEQQGYRYVWNGTQWKLRGGESQAVSEKKIIRIFLTLELFCYFCLFSVIILEVR